MICLSVEYFSTGQPLIEKKLVLQTKQIVGKKSFCLNFTAIKLLSYIYSVFEAHDIK